jgi:hypothetical protein
MIYFLNLGKLDCIFFVEDLITQKYQVCLLNIRLLVNVF